MQYNNGQSMAETLRFRMEYWKDGNWYVGRLPQVPGVFSQGATLQELENNVHDAYRLMLEEQMVHATR
jgi:predicted RNase H-like HicB family nuclease